MLNIFSDYLNDIPGLYVEIVELKMIMLKTCNVFEGNEGRKWTKALPKDRNFLWKFTIEGVFSNFYFAFSIS